MNGEAKEEVGSKIAFVLVFKIKDSDHDFGAII